MTLTLRINPIACTGHGACAEVAPELIEPDEWGYPILNAYQYSSNARHARPSPPAPCSPSSSSPPS